MRTTFISSSSPTVEGKSNSSPVDTQHSRVLAVVGLLAACTALAHCDAASAADSVAGGHSHVSAAIGDIAENEDFWANVGAYGRYFVSVMAGTAYVMTKPLTEAMKQPKTAVVAVIGTGTLLYFVAFAVKLMLGVDESFEYVSRGV